MKALKSVLYWTLIVFGIFGAGLTLAVLFERRAEAQPIPSMKCPYLIGNVTQCETHGITHWTAHWETRIAHRVAQHTQGQVVYLTVDDQWRELHVYIITRERTMDLFNGYIRIQDGKVVFGMQDKDGG